MTETIGPDRWDLIEAVFSRAMELPAHERKRFLETECRSDPALKGEVSALLDSAGSSEDYLSDLALRAGFPSSPDTHLGRWVGKRLGRWRLVELIGRGGMGAVYLAERDDDQFRMRAALKILPLGVISEDQRRRFLAEREILARLEHPNIAHILDGGVTEDGTPFFVMEYVTGVPIDLYCDNHSLSVGDRLLLFEQVCEAVQHAHGNLIVHKDLKPSNILVTEDGRVKLLDFGIARMLEAEGQGDRELTDFQGRAMTLPYASPEQIRGESVTTASDVYSLGLILFELLSGRHPYRHRIASTLSAMEAITETVPPPPSALVGWKEAGEGGTQIQGASAEALAEARRTTAPRLRRLLAGDLDTIVLMAIRKEAARRYASAAALADDIRNHRLSLPVSARADTLSYRLSRFARRYRTATAVGSLAAILAVALVILSVRSALTERAQARLIEREAATTEEVTEFLVGLFEFTNRPDGFADTIRARTLLDRGSDRIAGSLDGQPEIKVRMMRALARVYSNLGLQDEARALLEGVLEIRRKAFPEDELELAEDLASLAGTHRTMRNFELADPHYREALQIRRQHPGDSLALEDVLAGFALNLAELGQADSALVLNEEALSLSRQLRGPDGMGTLGNMGDRAVIFRAGAQTDSAEAIYRSILPTLREKGASARFLYSTTLNNLGYLLRTREDFAGAETMYREALPLEREINLPPRLITLLGNIASVETYQGDLVGAEAALLDRLEVAETAWPDGHWRVGGTQGSIADFYLRTDEPDKALPHAREQMQSFMITLGTDHWWTARARALVGVCLLALDRFAEAEISLLESHEALLRFGGPDHADTQGVIRRLVRLYERWGKPSEAGRFRSSLTATEGHKEGV